MHGEDSAGAHQPPHDAVGVEVRPLGIDQEEPGDVAVLDHLETGLDVDDLGPSVDPDFAEHLGGGVDDRDIVDDVSARAPDQHLFALVSHLAE